MPFDKPLAIVGMSCRLPGADNLDEYWNLIREGRCALGELPPSRMCRDRYFHPEKGRRAKSYTTVGGAVEPRPVDPSNWRLTQNTLDTADVVHLELCAVAEDALRHAGIDPRTLAGTRGGVYVGHTRGGTPAGRMTYGTLIEHTADYLREVDGFDQLVGGHAPEVIEEVIRSVREQCPTRSDRGGPACGAFEGARIVSEAFGLDGPYFSVDAACASSLMAMTMGIQALQLGKVDMAIFGGASRCEYDTMVLFSKAQSVSATGSRPFDEDADGLVAADGYVMIVMKTLEQALADNDPIRAVIRGVGISSDGRGKSLWAPRKEGQIQAIHRAYPSLDEISKLQFIEAHATSTQVGDATEIGALGEAIRDHLPAGAKIPIGSVKANVGHTLEVAGVAGLVKVVLALQHETIPPVTGVQKRNPKIDWENAPFDLPQAARHWDPPKGGGPRRAAVNAFGIGGLNTHIVIDEFLPQANLSANAATKGSGRARSTRTQAPQFEPIAIVGASSIFPNALHLDDFWKLLRSGASAIDEVPADRWRIDIAYRPGAPQAWRSPAKLGGFVKDFVYDWKKHRVPPKQVAKADPLQFMLLDAVDQALKDTEWDLSKTDRSLVGVIVGTSFGGNFAEQLQAGIHLPEFEHALTDILRRRGVSDHDIERVCQQYGDVLLSHMPALEDETGSFTPSTLASRITKTFDLCGGAASVDCGEASSHGALDICIQMLQTRRNDVMICAAGQQSTGLSNYEKLAAAGWLSTRDAPAPYEASSDGFVPGEGVGVVVLKRLSDAQRDGDQIHAVIRGVAVAKRQHLDEAVRQAAERCYESAAIDPQDVDTVVGAAVGVAEIDRQEVLGLDAALASRREPATLSSVTGQIGNCLGASGMASLLKAMLSLEHEEAAELKHGSQPATWLTERSSLRRVAANEPLDRERSVAAVNSHDMHNLAYHVAIEHPARTRSQSRSETGSQIQRDDKSTAPTVESALAKPRIVRVGGADLASVMRSVEKHLADPEAWFSSPDKASFYEDESARVAIVACDPQDLAKKARMAIDQRANAAARAALLDRGIYVGETSTRRPRVAFLFPGQASQYPGMLKSLIEQFEPAAEAVRRINRVLSQHGHPSFEEIAWRDGEQLGADPWRTQFAVLLGDSIVHASLWAMGIRPDRISGHSFGEWPALWAAGAWTFEDAVRATNLRCQAVQKHANCDGVMLSTTAPLAVVHELCQNTVDVFVTNHNSPSQVVLGGVEDAIASIKEQLENAGYKTLVLAVPCPFHTPLLEAAKRPLAESLRAIPLSPPTIPMLSSVTNSYVADPYAIRENLAEQLTEPVRFVDLVRRLSEDGVDILVEVGPGRVLTRLNREILGGSSDVVSIPSDDRNRDGYQSLLQVRACLEVMGAFATSGRDDLVWGATREGDPVESKSTRADAPTVTNASYESGRERGRKQARQIVAALRQVADLAGFDDSASRTVFAAGDVEKIFVPEELDQLRGIADGAKVSLPSLVAHNLACLAKAERPSVDGVGLLAKPRPECLALLRGESLEATPESAGTDGESSSVADGVLAADAYLRSLRESDDRDGGVCRRFVQRVVPVPIPDSAPRTSLAGAALIHGDNPVADAIESALSRAGLETRRITGDDTEACLTSLDAAWRQKPAAQLFLTSVYDRPNAETTPSDGVMTPFLVCQRWHELLKNSPEADRGCVVALTNLGGDFGLSRDCPSILGGALNGLMKALYVEEAQPGKSEGFRSLSIDADVQASPRQVADAVCAELAARTNEVEVAYLDGVRHVVRSIRQDASEPTSRVDGGVCVVTGGARGVTAVVARELGRKFGWRLHLIGASPAPRVEDAWRGLDEQKTKELRATIMRQARAEGRHPLESWSRIEKAIEMDANFQAFADAGVRVEYHACDISDRKALALTLDHIRQADGPIEGIVHGAGFEKSCRFKSKKPELIRRTLQAKVDGAVWLMELTAKDPVRFFVGFGSTSGCLGSHGQADYCAANDMLAKRIADYRRRRGVPATIFHWHAWDEVGMAVRPEIAGVLKGFGLNFMPTREGVNFLAEELRAGLPEAEVLITEWSHYRRLRPQTEHDADLVRHAADSADTSPRDRRAAMRSRAGSLQLPLIDEFESSDDEGRVIAVSHLDPSREPFLLQHTLRGRPVLPMVMGLELFAEAAAGICDEPIVGFENIEVINALRFFNDNVQSVRAILNRHGDRFSCEMVCDFFNQRGVLMQKDRPYLRAELRVGDMAPLPPQPEPDGPPDPSLWFEVEYPADDHVIYHGPLLRCLDKVFGTQDAAIAGVIAPRSLADLGGRRRGDNWVFDPALLDACFYGAGGHLWWYHHGSVAIPQSIDQLLLGRMPRLGEQCWLNIHFRGQTAERGQFDMTLAGDDGNVIFQINGYHGIIIPGTTA